MINALDNFYRLTPDEQVVKLESMAYKALQSWDISQPEIWLLKYRENCVFGVRDTATGTQYALRIHRPGYHSDAALRSELAWMDALHQDGIETPAVIKTADGQSVIHVQVAEVPEKRQCDILGWVGGEPLGNIEGNGDQTADQVRENYELAGQMAATIHNQAANWTIPEGFERPMMDGQGLVGIAGYLGDFRHHPDLTLEQRELLERAATQLMYDLEDFGKTSDRFSLTHADFLPENLLLDNGKVQIIDFDDCGFGWHIMDIATPLLFLLGEESYEPAYEGLVKGYRSKRDLPDSHLEMLPVCLLARILSYVAWAGTRHETETAQELSPMLIAGAVELAEELLSKSE